MSEPTSVAAKSPPIPRRAILAAGGGALILAGVTAAALARRPRRADGLPATADLGAAREIGDGFFLVDGWVLTADDLEALRSAARAGRP